MPSESGGGTTGPSATSTSDQSFVPTSLTSLIPTFDPASDSVEVWSQKVELLSKVWPSDKISELNTRLILNCKGSAFQKLQTRQKDLLKNELTSVKLLVELVGGQFGQVPLEKRYESAEKALFRCSQRSDETNDSYLARTDVAWAEFLAQDPPMALADLQAYVTLRGSLLSSEDKKRVLIEAGAEQGGSLTTKKVNAAIRMLGAGFFQDYTGAKKTRLKTYDQTAFHTEDLAEGDETAYNLEDDLDDDYIEALVQEGDEDAILVSEYEGAINDTIQDDQELAVALNAYSDARRRLSERFRNRGFWPIRSSKGKGKGSFKGKSKFGSGRKSLQDRILSSRCRICNKLGHWKAECPERAKSSTSSTSSGPTASITMTEGSRDQVQDRSMMCDDVLALEFMNLPETLLETPLDEARMQVNGVSFLSVGQALKGIRNRLGVKSKIQNSEIVASPRNEGWTHHEPAVLTANSADIMFASHGSFGVVDLGASKTVIGSNHLSELMQSFDVVTRDQLQRCPCKMQFRFGNQGILSSQQALVVPIGPLKVKIAIVPGNTPFLISNAFLRGLHAIVDTHQHHLRSPLLKQAVPLVLSPRGLFLMDLNEVIRVAKAPPTGVPTETVCQVVQNAENQGFDSPPKSSSHTDINTPNQSCFNPAANHMKMSQVDSVEKCSQSNVRSVTQDSQSPCVNSGESPVKHHVFGQSIVETASEGRGDPPKHRSLYHGAIGRDDDRLWKDSPRSILPSYVGSRTGVVPVAGTTLRPVNQHETSVGDQVHRDAGRHGRELEPQSACVSHQFRSNPDSDQWCGIHGQSQGCNSQGKEPANDQCQAGPDGQRGVRHAGGMGTSATSRWSDVDDTSRGCHVPARSYGEHGEHAPASVGTPAAKGRSCPSREVTGQGDESESHWTALLAAGDIDGEECFNHVGVGRQSPDRHRFIKALRKIETEYQQVFSKDTPNPKNHGNRVVLFEVFCSSKSRLTQQVQSLGGHANRYFKDQVDLMSPEGRAVLFQDLREQDPMHVWYAPECGPWSAWSNLNQAKSLQGWLDVQNKRWENMDQLALGVVLLRHQRSKGNHLHWEQPSRSHMFQTPVLQEVYTKTVAAEFDMCNLGDLRDPENGKHMRKGMVILTTSPNMQSLLHGHRCKGNHEHQPIEGSTICQGQRVNRTTFTENYPRKFARRVAAHLTKPGVRREKPWEWEKHEALASEIIEPHEKRRRISVRPAARSRLVREDRPKSEFEEQPPQRFRILQKGLGENGDQEIWKSIIEQLTPNLPRVGKQEIQQEDIRTKIQQLIRDKVVKSVIGGRALTRTTGPIKHLVKGEAPFRRMVYIHRTTDKIHITPWEAWEDLAKRKLVRTGFPSKVAITIFAANPHESIPVEAKRETGSGPGKSTELQELTPPLSGVEKPLSEIDAESDSHGPAFLNLSREDRSMLLKIHKNAGHPGPDKLAYMLRQCRAIDRNSSQQSQTYRVQLATSCQDPKCVGHQQFIHRVISTM